MTKKSTVWFEGRLIKIGDVLIFSYEEKQTVGTTVSFTAGSNEIVGKIIKNVRNKDKSKPHVWITHIQVTDFMDPIYVVH
jgi:hypothetical protein